MKHCARSDLRDLGDVTGHAPILQEAQDAQYPFHVKPARRPCCVIQVGDSPAVRLGPPPHVLVLAGMKGPPTVGHRHPGCTSVLRGPLSSGRHHEMQPSQAPRWHIPRRDGLRVCRMVAHAALDTGHPSRVGATPELAPGPTRGAAPRGRYFSCAHVSPPTGSQARSLQSQELPPPTQFLGWQEVRLGARAHFVPDRRSLAVKRLRALMRHVTKHERDTRFVALGEGHSRPLLWAAALRSQRAPCVPRRRDRSAAFRHVGAPD